MVLFIGIYVHTVYRLRVVDREDRSVYVEGFATFSDAKTEDLVPWTPLKTGQLL